MTFVITRRGIPSFFSRDLSRAFKLQPRDHARISLQKSTLPIALSVPRAIICGQQRWLSTEARWKGCGALGNARSCQSTTASGPLRIFSWQQFRALSTQNNDQSPPKRPALASRLRSLTPHEKIWNVPNILTFSRLFAAPLIGYLVLNDYHAWALGLFAYAGITDLVDGWVARKWKLQTVVGTVIDPMADKMLMTVLTVCLAVKGALPLYLATIILGRDVLLAMSAIYYRYISLPPPKNLWRHRGVLYTSICGQQSFSFELLTSSWWGLPEICLLCTARGQSSSYTC